MTTSTEQFRRCYYTARWHISVGIEEKYRDSDENVLCNKNRLCEQVIQNDFLLNDVAIHILFHPVGCYHRWHERLARYCGRAEGSNFIL